MITSSDSINTFEFNNFYLVAQTQNILIGVKKDLLEILEIRTAKK